MERINTSHVRTSMHALSEQEMQVDGLEKNAEIDRTSSCGSL